MAPHQAVVSIAKVRTAGGPGVALASPECICYSNFRDFVVLPRARSQKRTILSLRGEGGIYSLVSTCIKGRDDCWVKAPGGTQPSLR
jgi:hypothetical protein